MTISEIFAFKSTPNSWLGQLMDCTDPLNPIPRDLTGWDKVYIIFKKPNGEQWPTDQQMIDGFDQGAIVEDKTTPGGPVNLANANIKYQNLLTPSLLDQRGPWEYTPAARISGAIIKSPIKSLFWVD